jgi:AraC-like DNA-binding protein
MQKWTANLPMTGAYFELALREFGGTAQRDAALREGIGAATATPGMEITLGEQLQQIRNLNRLQAPGWALQLGSRFEAATHGAVGFAAVSAPTLADSLSVIERFGYLRAPFFRFAAARDAEWLSLHVDAHVPLDEEERIPLVELVMSGLQRLLESVRGAALQEIRFDFDWAAPSYADRYGEYFRGTVRFAAPRICLAVPLQWLGMKCPMADPGMYAASMRTIEALDRRLSAGDDHIVAHVEAFVAASTDAAPSLAQAAARLHLSTRTLIRRLRHVGTTFNELLDAHRRERAEALLGNRDFDIAEVGYRVGYGDPANFGRACRRWFGMAPSQYREQLLAGRAPVARKRPRR